MNTVFRFPLVLLLFPIALAAAPVESASKIDLEAAVDMAHGAPGEFAADALLRIAELDSLDVPRRIKLIEEAFARAAEAQQPYKRRNAMPNISSNAGFQQRAFAQNLDALSLRTRAVEEMLPLNSAKARELFLGMPPLDLPAASCEDVLVFDVSRYYEALSQVAQHAFTAKEVRNGDAFQFVQERLALISSPAEIAPAAHALANSTLDDKQFASALVTFTAALKKISRDDRSFTFYLPEAGAAIQGLIIDIQHRNASPLPLIEAYRLYLVANFGAARCADDDIMSGSNGSAPGTLLDERSAAAIRLFNESIRLAPLQPIQSTEAAAASKSGAASGLRSCESTECAAIARQYRNLIFDSMGSSLPNAARASAEWQDKFADVLAALRDWPDGGRDSSRPDSAEEFREKCAFYTDLADLPPDVPHREMALRAMLHYLQVNRDQAQTRLEWLLPLNQLIGRMGLDPRGLGRLTDDFRRSTDPVIAMYAQLEAVAPRTPSAVLALM